MYLFYFGISKKKLFIIFIRKLYKIHHIINLNNLHGNSKTFVQTTDKKEIIKTKVSM
jgi:hypothetical protein